MGTEATGSSCRSSNHTRSTDHRGETAIAAAGSLEGSSHLLTVTCSPHARSFGRKNSSQQPKCKKQKPKEEERKRPNYL